MIHNFYFTINSVEATLPALNWVIRDTNKLMKKKKLKVNEKETECLIIGTKHDITKYVGLKSVSISDEEIEMSSSVRDLGFIIANNLTCNEQIQAVIENAHLSL